MFQTKLRDKTLNLLNDYLVKVKLKAVAKDTGLELRWLAMFKNGDIKNPSVNRIETLYEYLTKSKLKV